MGHASIVGIEKRRRRRRGFSLTEVIIALFVLALLITLFAGSMMVSNAATGLNGQYAQALSLCQHKMDQLRAEGYGKLDWTDLHGLVLDETPITSPYSFAQIDDIASVLALKDKQGNIVQKPTATVSIVDSPTDNRVRIVTVTVSWRSTSRRPTNSTASLVGYIANTD